MRMNKSSIQPLTIDQTIRFVWDKFHKFQKLESLEREKEDPNIEQLNYIKNSLRECYYELSVLNKTKELIEKLTREKIREETPYHEL